MNQTGIAFPFRFSGSGGVRTSTTSFDSIDHILDGLAQLFTTHPTERVMEAPVGCYLSEVLFSNGEDTDLALAELHIREACEMYEGRIEIVSMSSSFDRDIPAIVVDLKLRDLQTDQVHDATFKYAEGGAQWQIG